MLSIGAYRSGLIGAMVAALWSSPCCWSQTGSDDKVVTAPAQPAADAKAQAATAQPNPAPVSPPGSAFLRWLNPTTLPFIPVPEIAVDPDSGTTLGVIPTWLHEDAQHDISRIIAPDVLHNPYFGWGVHARIYDYPSANEQWSFIASLWERVQRSADAEYQLGRLRDQRWSFNASLIYNRNGSPRFFGIGNNSLETAETNYTDTQYLAQMQAGINLTHAWQVLYTLRTQVQDIQPGTLRGIASIGTRFARLLGLGTQHELLNRISIVYDSRNDLTVPRRGMLWAAYVGLSSRGGIFNDSLYSETGVDGRAYWPLTPKSVVAAHLALRYLPNATRVPFWALSSIGGDNSVIGGEQPLRGYGEGRFYDRNSSSVSVELRQTVASFEAMATQVDIELTPFVDVGRVFDHTDTFPFTALHKVAGLGFRGIARPYVVGYVDIGYGNEGLAAFTGIYYPF